MSWRTRLTTIAQAALMLTVLAIAIGGYVGQPVAVSFVETGSMAPTLNPGDGFVAIPAAVTGPPEPGDVVVFDAEELEGGGLTTHRVVDVTDRGYLTRGDANQFIDQDGAEPPVQDPQIVATALQVNGEVLRLPHLGTGIMWIQDRFRTAQQWLAATLGVRQLLGTQGLAWALFGLSLAAYGVDRALDRLRPRSRERTRKRTRRATASYQLLLVGAVGIVVVAATAAMLVPAGATQLGIISAEFSSEQPTVIEQGATETLPYAVGNGGLVPVVSYFESSTPELTPSHEQITLGPREQTELSLTVTAPAETGHYRYYLTEYRYLAILPSAVIDGLYRIHPWVPLMTINLILGSAVYLLGQILLPSGRARTPTRASNP